MAWILLDAVKPPSWTRINSSREAYPRPSENEDTAGCWHIMEDELAEKPLNQLRGGCRCGVCGVRHWGWQLDDQGEADGSILLTASHLRPRSNAWLQRRRKNKKDTAVSRQAAMIRNRSMYLHAASDPGSRTELSFVCIAESEDNKECLIGPNLLANSFRRLGFPG